MILDVILVPLSFTWFLKISEETLELIGKYTKEDFERYGVYSYLTNAFLHKEKKILKLIYRFNSHETYLHLEEELQKHRLFLELKEEGLKFVAAYFKIPEIFYDDIDLFIKGEYSNFSARLKFAILQFLKDDLSVAARMYQVLNKDPSLQEAIGDNLGINPEDVEELDSKPTKHDFYE